MNQIREISETHKVKFRQILWFVLKPVVGSYINQLSTILAILIGWIIIKQLVSGSTFSNVKISSCLFCCIVCICLFVCLFVFFFFFFWLLGGQNEQFPHITSKFWWEFFSTLRHCGSSMIKGSICKNFGWPHRKKAGKTVLILWHPCIKLQSMFSMLRS